MRLDQRLLHGVLGRREVVPAPDEDTEHLRREVAQDLPRSLRAPGTSSMTGRTSSHSWIGLPPLPGAFDTRAATS